MGKTLSAVIKAKHLQIAPVCLRSHWNIYLLTYGQKVDVAVESACADFFCKWLWPTPSSISILFPLLYFLVLQNNEYNFTVSFYLQWLTMDN